MFQNIKFKKWVILFSILVFPYLIIQVFEKATHNILTLGYKLQERPIIDSLGNISQIIDSLKIPTFQLLSQDQEVVSDDDLLGYNYVINFFFTSCPGICKPMTSNLIELQKKIKEFDIENFKIISISVDPVNDSPEKMKNYAHLNNIDLFNWEFLTGSESEIYDISYPLGDNYNGHNPGTHSSFITIIDDKGYVRTGLDKKKEIKYVYDGTSQSDIKLLMGEIQRLSITNYKDNYEIKRY